MQYPPSIRDSEPAAVASSRPAGARAINLVFFGIGMVTLGLLAYRVGVRHLASEIGNVGSSFWIILLIELCSNAASCRGWLHTFDRAERPSYARLLLTGLASLSVAGALPSGQAGELAKANLLRGRVKGASIVSSLLLFNYLHMLTTCALVAICALIGIASAMFPSRVAVLVLVIGVALTAGTAGGGVLLQSGVIERTLVAARRQPVRWLRPPTKWLQTAAAIDGALRAFDRRELLRAAVWLALGRWFQVLEVYVVLAGLGLDASLPVVAMVYAITSVANYLLMVLPAREGFLEGSSFLAFGLLGFSRLSGLSFELVRRLRKAVYQLIGLVIMVGLAASDRRSAAVESPTQLDVR